MKRASCGSIQWLISGSLLMVAAYATYAGITWIRYGQGRHKTTDSNCDSQLENLIPVFDVVERFKLPIAAPAKQTFTAACNLDLLEPRFIRAIFRIRRMALGSQEQESRRRLGLVNQAKAWGWNALAEQPGREIVFGAATQPWIANPVFRGIAPEEFRTFQEPGFVKIAWTLRADPTGKRSSVATTETRAVATDEAARAMFRWYWALVSPGTALIRLIALRRVKRELEHTAVDRSI